jgi:hypothetical protein
MGVNENVLDEIYSERAQYLVNIDDMMYEIYCEPIFDKRAGISHEAPIYSCDIELVNKIKVADQIFASKEYQKNIQLTGPEDISEGKFPSSPHKKLRHEELQDFENIDED